MVERLANSRAWSLGLTASGSGSGSVELEAECEAEREAGAESEWAAGAGEGEGAAMAFAPRRVRTMARLAWGWRGWEGRAEGRKREREGREGAWRRDVGVNKGRGMLSATGAGGWQMDNAENTFGSPCEHAAGAWHRSNQMAWCVP